jgi:hypothetical protein
MLVMIEEWPFLEGGSIFSAVTCKALRSVTVAVLAALLMSACDVMKPSTEQSISARLTSMVEAPDRQGDIRIASLTDFEWDRLYIFGPLTSAARVNETLGFRWDDYAKFGTETAGDHNLLVLLKGNNVIRAEKHPRVHGDFAPWTRERMLTPSTAVFSVRMRGRGDTSQIMLVPARPALDPSPK